MKKVLTYNNYIDNYNNYLDTKMQKLKNKYEDPDIIHFSFIPTKTNNNFKTSWKNNSNDTTMFLNTFFNSNTNGNESERRPKYVSKSYNNNDLLAIMIKNSLCDE
jgi:hypothetical protein